uniref:Glycoprotein n=1 Tax=Caenorhabditis tropicalis TaxID=1561998 RepID=A0A1I7TLH7_9PELO
MGNRKNLVHRILTPRLLRRNEERYRETETLVKKFKREKEYDVGKSFADDGIGKEDEGAGDQIKNTARNFCEQTTFHGVNMIFTTSLYWVRVLWGLVICVSICLLMYSFSHVIAKYGRKEKIVNVELDAFHQAVVYSNDATIDELTGRGKRSLNDGLNFKYLQYEPVYSDCVCIPGKDECIGNLSILFSLSLNDIQLKLQFHKAWKTRAYVITIDRTAVLGRVIVLSITWEKAICPECNDIGFCNVPNTTGNGNIPCYCQLAMGYCVFMPETRVRRIWEFQGNKIPEKGSPLRKEYLEQLTQLGYGNMTDQVAITTQAKEKMILKMSALHPQRRAALGYGKSELIKMCSFNGQQCNIEKDFKLFIDSSFGNCYTFNHDPKINLTSSRAGPSYGLRLMLFVNTSDYLPTTEATGVRLAIHDKEECPFPDTFGYSAPTGAISSFGISLRKVNRLDEPVGSCYDMNCLTTEGSKLSLGSKSPSKNKHWKCMHPCIQDQYTTTYSAAKWPSGSIQAQCENHAKDCNRYLREHAAMIEIFYEQMSFEILRESISYSLFNLMADMGGQTGLFLGASIMSLIDFLFFVVRTLGIACKSRRWKKKNELLQSERINDIEKEAATNNNC